MKLRDYLSCKSQLISEDAYCYGPCTILIGEGSRIDHGCILMGNIRIGKKTHIPPYCILYGKYGITIGDFVNLGAFTSIHSESESFSGEWLMGPLVPEELRRPVRRPVFVDSLATIATRCSVMPGVRIGRGSVLGAHSLVFSDVPPFEKWAGAPARRIGPLSRRCESLLASL